MKIIKDESFNQLDALLSFPNLEQDILNILQDKDIIGGDAEEEYNQSINDLCRLYDANVQVICAVCLGSYSSELLSLFKKLVIFGDGDCEMCGGNMQPYHSYGDNMGDNLTPQNYNSDYKCEICGEVKENY